MLKRTSAVLLLLVLLAAPLSGQVRTGGAAVNKPSANKDAQSAYWKAKAKSLLGDRQFIATHDTSGRVTSISILSPDGRGLGLSFRLQYDEQNVLQAMLAADGSKTQFSYDREGRLRRLDGSDGASLKIARDEFGKVISMRRVTKPAKINSAVYMPGDGHGVTYEAAGLRCIGARAAQAAAYAYAVGVCSGTIPGDCNDAVEAYEATRRWADFVCAGDSEIAAEESAQ